MTVKNDWTIHVEKDKEELNIDLSDEDIKGMTKISF